MFFFIESSFNASVVISFPHRALRLTIKETHSKFKHLACVGAGCRYLLQPPQPSSHSHSYCP